MNTTILLKLILSHILTDFFLQPNAWIKDKQQHKAKSKYLYLHGAIAGILTFVFTSEWTISAFILITHILIDLWKLYQNDGLKYFLIDQFLHFIMLIISWLWLIDGFQKVFPTIQKVAELNANWAIIIAYLLCTTPLSFLIEKATKQWQNEISKEETLLNAGKWIGIAERILTLTFVLIDKFEPIGFLLAAKSILRFKETDSKKSEYVLIGTLLSFGFSVLIGLIVKKLAL
jgi:hypothetical protein